MALIKDKIILVFFLVFLIGISITIFTSFYNIHLAEIDADDYAGVAKGIFDFQKNNLLSPIRGAHSWGYGILLFFFLKINYSIFLINLANFIILLFVAFLLLKISDDHIPVILLFSSLAFWYHIYNISPIPLASGFLLIFYFLTKKFFVTEKIIFLVFASFLLGFAVIFWSILFFVGPVLIFIFLFNQKTKHFLIGMLFFLIGLVPNILLEWNLFNMPFYSILRSVFAGPFLSLLKISVYQGHSYPLTDYIIYILAVSPLSIYFIFKILRQKKFKEFFSIAFLFLLFLSNAQLRYAMFFSPLLFLFAGNYLTKKEVAIHIILSLILVSFFVYADFSKISNESYILKDLSKIGKEYPGQSFIFGKNPNDPYNIDSGEYISMFCWKCNLGDFYSYWEYELALKNTTLLFEYSLKNKGRIPLTKNIKISGEAFTTEERMKNVKKVRYLAEFGNSTQYDEFSLRKCYNKLCIFEK